MTKSRFIPIAVLIGWLVAVTYPLACSHRYDTQRDPSATPGATIVTRDEMWPFFAFKTIHLIMLQQRMPGPLPAQEVEKYIDTLEARRKYVSGFFPRNYRELRLVMTASTEDLSGYLLSDDDVLADEAAFEAALRADKRLLPALVESLNRISFVPVQEMTAPPHGLYPRRVTIVSAIGRIETSEALGALRQLVKHPDAYVRLTAAYLLAQRGEKDGMSALREGVSLPTQRVDVQVRESLAEALLNIGFGTTKSELDELFDSLDSEARHLCPILAKRGDEVSLAYLREQVVNKSRYHGVRKWAAMALGQALDKAAIPYLQQALNDPIREVREEAQKAIRLIEGSPPSGR